MVLGTQGPVFQCLQKAMTALGVSHFDQKTLARKLSDHATIALRNILRARRHTEDKGFGQEEQGNHQTDIEDAYRARAPELYRYKLC